MPRRKWETVSPDNILKAIKEAGFSDANTVTTVPTERDDDEIEELGERIKKLLALTTNENRSQKNMIFFVMYDIESNKVRTLVAKYLIAQGCIRIQNSIFIADAPAERCQSIKRDLLAVQQTYQNNDSILVVPVSTDSIATMHIIGKTIDLDFITKSKKMLFF